MFSGLCVCVFLAGHNREPERRLNRSIFCSGCGLQCAQGITCWAGIEIPSREGHFYTWTCTDVSACILNTFDFIRKWAAAMRPLAISTVAACYGFVDSYNKSTTNQSMAFESVEK